MLTWRSITPSNDPKFFVKGTVLEKAIVPNTLSRFAVISIRCQDADGYPDMRYGLEDAATVSDAQVREGGKPKRVASFPTLEEALAWAAAQV